MSKKLAVLFAVLSFLFMGTFAVGQALESDEFKTGQNSSEAALVPDPGIPDTVTVESKILPAGTTDFTVDVYLYNDEELMGFDIPLIWDSPDITLDTVMWTGSPVETWMIHAYKVDTLNRKFHAGALAMFEPRIQPGNYLLFTAVFSVDPGASDQVINLDSAFYPPASQLYLTLSSSFNIFPQFNKGVITLGDPQPPAPTIGVSPTSFDFSAVEGESNPSSQTLTITNDGDGTLNWSSAVASSWLSLNPTSGTGGASVDVSVDITGLTADVYEDTIVISDPNATNSPQKIPVTLTLDSPPPTIVLSSGTFSFSAVEGDPNPADQFLTITNSGGSALSWSALSDQSWLTLSPLTGTDGEMITLSVDITGLSANVYSASITITDPEATNSPQIANVILAIAGPPPTIILSHNLFIFNAFVGDPNPPDQSLTVTNGGGGSLAWTASNSSGWLSISPLSGTGGTTINLSVDITGLGEGLYYDTITVTDPAASNDPQMAQIILTVYPEPPHLLLSHMTRTFLATENGSNPANKDITVYNTGGGSLNWTATNSSGWLSLNPTSGTDGDAITLSVDITGLTVDVYYDTVFVSDPSADNSPQKTEIILTIVPAPPHIVLSSDVFTFSGVEGEGNPIDQYLTVNNSGGEPLNWTATKLSGWLSIAPTTGTDGTVITLSVNIAGLTEGIYTDTITVADSNANNSPQGAVVVLTIGPPPPIIVLSAGHFDFEAVEGGANPDDQFLTVTNGGGGSLNWTAQNLYPWLTIAPTSGSDGTVITLSINITGLTAGTYWDTVTVVDYDAANVARQAEVQLTITEAPCAELIFDVINFSGEVGSGPLTEPNIIVNCGSAPVVWEVSGLDASWLTIIPDSGIVLDYDSILFTADLTGLAVGDYADTVTFSSPDPTVLNLPQDVIVNLSVYAPSGEDTVYIAHESGYPGDQVVIDISYTNFTPTGGFSMPLYFFGAGILCDSVSFVGSRVEFMDAIIGIVDNDLGTIVVGGVAILGPPLDAGSGLLAKLYFSIDVAAPVQIVPIDSAFIPPNFEFNFVDQFGSPKITNFGAGELSVLGQPCFDFPVDTVAFSGDVGDTFPSLSFAMNNACSGSLDWTVHTDSAWLTISPMSGTDGTIVDFSVDATGLGAGVYLAPAIFEDPHASNSPFIVPIKLILNQPIQPVLAISPHTFDFGTVCQGDTAESSFEITNTGNGDLNWTATATGSIMLFDYSGSAPSTVGFYMPTELMATGAHHLTITITADGAVNSPQDIEIDLFVANCDDCSLDIAEVEGTQGFPVGVPVYAYNIENVAGGQFHIWYDTNILASWPDSITSDYIGGPTIGFADDKVHYVWESVANPITVPDGEPIITLWFTVIGQIGETSPLNWMGFNELVDPNAQEILGITYCNGSVTVVQPTHDLMGRIIYYDMIKDVPDVEVMLSTDDAWLEFAYTNSDGEYIFPDLLDDTYILTANRLDHDPGVTVADAVKIQRHLAFVELFDSPYKMIAADVDINNYVSVTDVVRIRLYIAKLEGTLPSGNWVFVDSAFAANMDNWSSAPRSILAEMAGHDLSVQAFIGIRMGDVNNSWEHMKGSFKSALSSTSVVEVKLDDSYISPGESISVPINVSHADQLAGLELHFSFDQNQLTVTDIESETLQGMTINADGDQIHIVWEDFANPVEISGTQKIATLNFMVSDRFHSTTTIGISGAEVVNSEGEPYTLDLSGAVLFSEANNNPALPGQYSLRQNVPNPFNPTTRIEASLRYPGEYSLTIYNVMGEKIREYKGWQEAGLIEFIWDGLDDSGRRISSGIFLYRFESGDFSQTRKMLLLK